MGLAVLFTLFLCVSALELSLKNLSSTTQQFNFVSVGTFPTNASGQVVVANNAGISWCDQEKLGVLFPVIAISTVNALTTANWFPGVPGDEILFINRTDLTSANFTVRDVDKTQSWVLPISFIDAPFSIVTGNFYIASELGAVLVSKSEMKFISASSSSVNVFPLPSNCTALSAHAGIFDGTDMLSDLAVVCLSNQGS